MSKLPDYRVVVDFGAIYSGFAYSHKKPPNEIFTHTDWQEYAGRFKTPTVLLYDDDLKSVQSWGFSALAKRPKRKKVIDKKPVELFKLHLGKFANKPSLPNGLDYKKAITDYLHEFGKVVISKIKDCWPNIDFFTQVLLVFTVPAEFDDNAISIMRECIFKAGLLKNQLARNLKFITELEAAAIHCMKSLKEHGISVGANFMLVDCGNDTIDLTTRQILEGERLSKITERSGDYCGGSSVDQEFLKFLESKVGANTISQVRENHCCQFQFLVQEFVRMIRMKFTGEPSEFEDTELELDEICPVIKQYCKGKYFDEMDYIDWIVDLNFNDVKKFFDPTIKKIIRLIDSQLHLSNDCSAIMLVGDFSESKYLQSRIKQEFSSKVKLISMPPQPTLAKIKGAVEYGLKWEDAPYISYDEEIKTFDDEKFDDEEIQSFDDEEKKLQDEIQNNIKQYKFLYNKLQKKYTDLTNKNIDQHQMIVNKLKKEIEEIKEINQKNRSKIESQEQMVNQLQQSLELKEDHIQDLEKEKEELNIKIESLLQKNTNLDTQLKSVVQQTALLDKEINDLNVINQKQQQRIDRSQQSLELVKNQMKNLEKVKDDEINKYKLMCDKYKEKYMELLKNNEEKIIIK
ncbi:hypothetical protein GLOIN_2v1886005 [Rhizophagus clarus]|uniref:Hsp70 family protein n=2 Tax=Rhizophagus clarus TaxID=94130 RepID=A0A8H3R1Y6_9GLOM|nr:hypothetical protein GLOIN_2v1886005 [Rhizophagus clarus]